MKFIKGYNPDAPQALFSLYKYNTKFPNYVPKLDGLMLSGSAKLTDFISTAFSVNLFVISEKVKCVFEQYQLCPHRFYPLGLYKRKVKCNYFLFAVISDYSNCVDYKKTTFSEYNMITRARGNRVIVESRKDLFQKRSKLECKKGVQWTIWGEEIVMSDDFNRELDFFSISRIDSSTYISGRLKNSIEACGLTGWDFMPAHNLIVENVTDRLKNQE